MKATLEDVTGTEKESIKTFDELIKSIKSKTAEIEALTESLQELNIKRRRIGTEQSGNLAEGPE